MCVKKSGAHTSFTIFEISGTHVSLKSGDQTAHKADFGGVPRRSNLRFSEYPCCADCKDVGIHCEEMTREMRSVTNSDK